MDLIDQYRELRPQYLVFTEKLKKLFEDLIAEIPVDYHLIESRTKETQSFEEKVKRKQYTYKDIIEVTDLSGIRIIVYYNDDIRKIIYLIENEFEVDVANSLIKGDEYNSNEFGYLSSHIVCKIGKSRKNLPEWKKYSDFKTEIQIRTVLQHSWASISHTLQYKTKQDIPKILQRKLFRLAGLFELADEQFTGIRDDHRKLSVDIENEDISKNDGEINLLLIKKYIETSPNIKSIYSLALNVGFANRKDSDLDESNTFSELVTLCNEFHIPSIKQLDLHLKSIPAKKIENYLAHQINKAKKEGCREWYVSPVFIVILIILYLFKNELNVKILVENGWEKMTAKRVITQAKSFND